MYTYNSPAGLMIIRYMPHIRKYALIINGIVYEHHPSAQSAADNVYVHVTGCYEWDSLDGLVDPPTDISEWNRV